MIRNKITGWTDISGEDQCFAHQRDATRFHKKTKITCKYDDRICYKMYECFSMQTQRISSENVCIDWNSRTILKCV